MVVESNKSRLPGLDGLRALFAIIILSGHILQPDFAAWSEKPASYLPPCCVYLFFVLSGFMAGYKEDTVTSVPNYYRKRAKRILPLYYGYIFACLLTYFAIGEIDTVFNTCLPWYFTLVPQIPFCSKADAILPLVHLWYIGPLVMFYLLFPLIAISTGRKNRLGLYIAIGWVVLKCLLYLLVGKASFIYKLISVSSFDCLFFGVWLGMTVKKGNSQLVSLGNNRPLGILIWALFLLSGFYGDYIPSVIRNDYMAILGGGLIINQLSLRPAVSLNNMVCNWIGSISYEIYVVQILLILLLSRLYVYTGGRWPVWLVFLMCMLSVISVAYLVKPKRKSFILTGK